MQREAINEGLKSSERWAVLFTGKGKENDSWENEWLGKG